MQRATCHQPKIKTVMNLKSPSLSRRGDKLFSASTHKGLKAVFHSFMATPTDPRGKRSFILFIFLCCSIKTTKKEKQNSDAVVEEHVFALESSAGDLRADVAQRRKNKKLTKK